VCVCVCVCVWSTYFGNFTAKIKSVTKKKYFWHLADDGGNTNFHGKSKELLDKTNNSENNYFIYALSLNYVILKKKQ
jgi:hypothetical protein